MFICFFFLSLHLTLSLRVFVTDCALKLILRFFLNRLILHGSCVEPHEKFIIRYQVVEKLCLLLRNVDELLVPLHQSDKSSIYQALSGFAHTHTQNNNEMENQHQSTKDESDELKKSWAPTWKSFSMWIKKVSQNSIFCHCQFSKICDSLNEQWPGWRNDKWIGSKW